MENINQRDNKREISKNTHNRRQDKDQGDGEGESSGRKPPGIEKGWMKPGRKQTPVKH